MVLAIALAVLAWCFRDTLLTMVDKWYGDTAFTYGFVIAPISVWLAWHKREWLQRVTYAPSWLGVVALLAAAFAWIVARGTGVLVVEQLAFVAMISAVVLAVLGWQAFRVLLFPLGYLVFMVPFGRWVVPTLVDFTADVATWALQSSGIPILRNNAYISIPDGSFEVAKACSGVNFLMAMLVLSVLYGYLNYASWKKRVALVAAVIVVAVLQNGIRVYITIAVSHLTQMRFGPGAEHVLFAQVFSIIVMLTLGWVCLRWRDAEPPMPAWLLRTRASTLPGMTLVTWVPVVAALGIMAGAPIYRAGFADKLRERLPDVAHAVQMPASVPGWQGPIAGAPGWRPEYRNGLVERLGSYLNASGDRVDAFVAIYGIGTSLGAEMISFQNVLYEAEKASVGHVTQREVRLAGGRMLRVREVIVPDPNGTYLVWHWYMFGEQPLTNPFAVKAMEALAWVTRGADLERSVTLATPNDDRAAERLQNFVSASPQCVSSGFAAEACGQ